MPNPQIATRICSALVVAMFMWSADAKAQTQVTLEANAHQSIGNVSQLDRAKFFPFVQTTVPPTSTNLGNLLQNLVAPHELHTSTGRIHTEITSTIASFVSEDPAKPGFFDHTELVNRIQGHYRNRVLTSNSWLPLRIDDNPLLVTSGRNGGQWPDFLDGGGEIPTNYESYADFMNVFYEEVVYGPNAFLPIPADRFHFEILNEPQWTSVPWVDVIEQHKTVTELVKEEHPQASIGGGSCCSNYNSTNNGWDMAKQMLDDMADWETPSGAPAPFDFFSIHVYERYDVAADGSYSQATFHSPGHLTGLLDLYESYIDQEFSTPMPFSFSEYGSYNQTAMADGSYGSYARDLQQWDMVRNIREKMMVLMQRPDRILNSVPFVAPTAWQGGIPTHPDADRVMWERDANGDWHETIVASMYRMFAPIEGEYIGVSSDNIDVQTVAFRDGDKVYLVLNNLEQTNESVNLSALLGAGDSVSNASIDRIHRTGGVNTFDQGVDVTATWQNLTLAPEEGAVLTLTLAGPQIFDIAKNQATYYGDTVSLPLDGNGDSTNVNITADKENALNAQVRVAFTRQGVGAAGEAFDIVVNGNTIAVPAMSVNFDDNDDDVVARTIDVPLSMINDGANTVSVDFSGSGGELISAVLVMDHSIGDFNDSGIFDTGDLNVLVQNFGPASPGSELDLVADGVIDMQDINYWIEELRGAAFLPGDYNFDGTVDAADYTIWRDQQGSTGGLYLADGTGLTTPGVPDGTVDLFDYAYWWERYGDTVTGPSSSATIPEPTTAMLIFGCVCGSWAAGRSR